jgi:transmembrane sensor
MNNQEFKTLLRQYQEGNCTAEEKQLIEAWYMKFEQSTVVSLTDEEIEGILSMVPPVRAITERKPLWKWAAVAAAMLAIVSGSIYYAAHRSPTTNQVIAKSASDIKPGINNAILTLANGKQIALNQATDGLVSTESNTTISKTANGEIVYQTKDLSSKNQAVLFNTMTVPRGGQYHLKLADGTNIWLNAASSITYPTQFVGNERTVEITGEAYFEVSHLIGRPFKVISKGQVVEVLGTHFNINTYENEQVVKTTLLQGAVKITAAGITQQLAPGEQAIFSSNGLKVVNADTEQAVAWHNGDFIFKKNSVEEILRTVSRWYDIEVDYGKYSPIKQTFSGLVSRSKDLSAVINMMEKGTTLKFKVEGKRVTVTN